MASHRAVLGPEESASVLTKLDVVGDLRIASRVLRREWRAAASAAACIAIGIGASTAMFAAADALLLRPFPFPNGDLLAVAQTILDAGHRHANAWGVNGDARPFRLALES